MSVVHVLHAHRNNTMSIHDFVVTILAMFLQHCLGCDCVAGFAPFILMDVDDVIDSFSNDIPTPSLELQSVCEGITKMNTHRIVT